MFLTRPVRPQEARRLLAASLRRLDALTLETFTPVWTRPRPER
jgi:hypothetical protein